MKNRNLAISPVVVDIYLQNTSKRRGEELKGRIRQKLPGSDSTNRHFYTMYCSAGPEILGLVHEVFFFISAHKAGIIAAGVYPAKKVVDIVAEIAKEWAKSRFKKRAYRFYLYGPDDKPVRAFEVREGKETRVTGPWKEYARERCDFLRKHD
jgi:hypothetical protein